MNIGTCHRFPPKRMDFVTFDFLSPFVESKRDFKPLNVHSKVMLDDSEYSDSNSMWAITVQAEVNKREGQSFAIKLFLDLLYKSSLRLKLIGYMNLLLLQHFAEVILALALTACRRLRSRNGGFTWPILFVS